MRILGIDPGVTRCGYGVLDVSSRNDVAVVSAGVLTTSVKDHIAVRLRSLQDDLEALFKEFEPRVAVVERVFFQTNARTAMSVGQASGLALVAAARRECEIAQYTANEVKMCITGDGAAEKIQTQEMVQRLLGLSEMPKPPDVADALALALCHVTQARFHERAAQAAMA